LKKGNKRNGEKKEQHFFLKFREKKIRKVRRQKNQKKPKIQETKWGDI
jgi:hypothetical protein